MAKSGYERLKAWRQRNREEANRRAREYRRRKKIRAEMARAEEERAASVDADDNNAIACD